MLESILIVIIQWVIVFRIIWNFDEMTNERIDNLQWSIDILLNRIEELEEERKRDN